MKDYSEHKKYDKKKIKKEKPFDFISNTLKILQSKKPIPDGFSKKGIYKYPFEILENLSKEEKNDTLNEIRSEYNKYFSEEYEIAKQFWKSMNYISFFLCDESKKNLLKNEEMMSLLDNYKSEEEMSQIETEIKKNMNSDSEDTEFWKNCYELLNYFKNKKLMEDLYNNFINNQRINHKLEIIEEKENEKDEDNEDNEDDSKINNYNELNNNNNNKDKGINKNKDKNPKINNYLDDVDEIDNVDNYGDVDDDIDMDKYKEKEKENKEKKQKKKKEISYKERYNIISEDLKKLRYNKFLNEEDSEGSNANLNDDEVTEDDLSPPKYDSDDELSKNAINQMDYIAMLNANRKKILSSKVNEYIDNKRIEKINKKTKNKKKNKDNKNNNSNNINNNNNNIININENEEENNNNNNNNNSNKKKPISFLDFIMNQKAQKTEKKEKIEEESDKEKNEEESNQEAIDFLQKISKHKNKKNNLLDTYNEEYTNTNKKKEEENVEEENQLSAFQKTIQNFDKYLDKNDISGVYTNFEIIENTFRDLEKNTDNELVFNDVVEIKKDYEWSKEYKPIKPRYSNKKIIGFDWNRHNQAHYDNENLPPKTVNGYRFNIFYPNLVDKTKTPKFYLQRSETPDMCIIRFESGAPYEDVAFKIINREWNTRVKGDFLNIFDKGVLKLYFKFKRFRYKR